MTSETSHYLLSVPEEHVEIGTLCHCILLDAISAGASDVHIEPWSNSLVIRLRVNGKLRVLDHIPIGLGDKIAARFRVMCELSSHEKWMPSEGRISTDEELGNVVLRVSIFPLTDGEKVVIRIFDPRKRALDLDGLGFEEEVKEQFITQLLKTSGLILLTGPTGSGKTTAIYSALSWLIAQNGPEISISTVEDPVEIPLEMASQSQINPVQGFTYPVALRSLLRQDPQVIMIGEIRDADTAAIAVQASLTGHLVISTIHSGNTAGVFARMFNMGIEPFLLCSSIIASVGLRLVRDNCAYCSYEYQPDDAQLVKIPHELLEGAIFRRGAGCDECDFSGYGSRRSIVEFLSPSEEFREAVMQKRSNRELQQVALNEGMRSLWDHGISRVLRGETTIEEIQAAVTQDQV